jgi:hypothetical protein
MLDKLIAIAKKNWIFVALTAIVVLAMIFFSKMEKYYDYEYMGCSTCSSGEAGVLPGSVATMVYDKEYEGCQTCDAGDAGVLEDTEQEMYQMPDDYYGSDVKVADTIAEVAENPSVIAAVVEDRENEFMTPMQIQDNLAQAIYNATVDRPYVDGEDADLMSIDPIDYTLQSDAQLINDFYGDDEIDYKERERIAAVKALPIDFYMSDSSFTLL